MSAPCRHLEAFLDGTITAEARAEFTAHLPTCASCQVKVERWASFSQAFKETTAPMLDAPAPGDVARLMAKVEAPRRSLVPRLALAAGALAAVVVAVVLVTQRGESALEARVDGQVLEGNRVETADASEKTVAVAGANIVVTPRSTLVLAKRTKREVRLELEAGAVRLQVSHREKEQTFVVRSGGWETFVVGTAFSVSRVGETIEVQVTEGKVRVASGADAFEVPAGKTFRAVGEKGGLVELAPAPEVEPADAGVEVVATPEVEPEKRPSKPAVSDIERWRKLASSGGCATVIPEASRAVAKAPRAVESWSVLADCQRLTRDDAALGSYEKVIRLGKRDDADRARVFLADLLQQRSKHAEAIAVLRDYLSHAQPPELEASARLRLAKSLLASGQKAKARAELETVTKKRPGTSAALQALELLESIDAR